MLGLAILDYSVMIGYMLVVLTLGIWLSRKKGAEADTNDYLLGGRGMPWWAVGMSLVVSLFSTLSLVALPGEIFRVGLTYITLTMSLRLFCSLPWFFVFVRFYFRVKTFTPFSYLENRFDWRVRLIGTIIFWFYRFTYIGLVLYSSAKVLEGAAGWPVWVTILVVGAIGIFYTTLGGIKAVIWVDVLQFIVLSIGLLWIVSKVCGMVPGGASGIVSYAFENGRGFPNLNKPGFFELSPYVRLCFWAVLLEVSFRGGIFGFAGDQIYIQRLLSTSSYKQAKKSFYFSELSNYASVIVLSFLGLAMFAYFGHNPIGEELGGDTILFHFIATRLPTPLPGVMLAAMLAAVMSTLDSGINSLAAVATKDIYLRHFKPDASEHQQVSFSKLVTLITGCVAVLIGIMIAYIAEELKESVLEAQAIWGTFICLLVPAFLMGVVTTRVNARHILLGMIVGTITSVVMITWYVLNKGSDHEVSFMWLFPAGCVTMIAFCSLPVIFRCKQVDSSKIDGLTLWTLRKKKTVSEIQN